MARGVLSFSLHECVGFYVDPGYTKETEIAGLPVVHRKEDLRGDCYFLGVGEPKTRLHLIRRAEEMGLRPVPGFNSVHTFIFDDLVSGPGSGAAYGATVESGVTIGSNVLLMYNVVIGHDVTIGDNVVFAPGTVVGGYAKIGSNVFFGANVVVAPGVTIGDGCQIASGAACFKDVPPDKRVLGNPGRAVSLVTERLS